MVINVVGPTAVRECDDAVFIRAGPETGVAATKTFSSQVVTGALKLKEISYEHAEGFPAGELKHGPLALVTPDTPVFAVCTGRYPDKLRGTIEEVSARGAPVFVFTTEAHESVGAPADETLLVPDTHPELVGVLANVKLQLFSYHTARQQNRPVDKPRNLAKSVTVE